MKVSIRNIAMAMMILCGYFSQAQEQSEEIDWDNLSLEQLMNIPINSASKKDEMLFDAPLSSYTITRADIDNAGPTTIMEALRLAPGVIVREQSNGTYDIHIRGLDNLLRHSETTTKANLATLVMIDNRPVFNNNLGGTFWESLPIDLNDVDRIEIVRGPSAPLFGPNAVTGVINIITRQMNKDYLLNVNVQSGTAQMLATSISAGRSFNKFSILLSGNYQDRNRFQNTYYRPGDGRYHTVDELAGFFGEGIYKQYKNPEQAMNKFGMNVFMDYKFTDDIKLNVTAGTQQSEVQKIFLSNVFRNSLPFTTNETSSQYVNVAAKVKGLNFRSSYLNGYDNLAVNAAPNQYDYNVFDLSAEYDFSLGKIGSIVPGVSFHDATLSDKDYVTQGLVFLGGGSPEIKTTSAFIRSDLQPTKALRVIAALRIDKFSAPDDAYLAYELASTYKITSKSLVRAAITRSNSGSFIGYNYLDLTVPISQNLNIERRGSTDLDLYTVNMIEVGFRSQFSKSFHIDLDIFRQTVDNLTALHTTNGIDPGNGSFVATEQTFLNVPTISTQHGFTFGINYLPNNKLHIKPFVTIQETQTENLPSSFLEPSLANNLGVPVTYTDSKHTNTPGIFGGYYINYKVSRNVNVNVNGYFFGSHRQYDQSDLADNRTAGDIDGKVLINSKVSYSMRKFTFFVNGRNLLNRESTEFYGADRTSRLLTAGGSFSL